MPGPLIEVEGRVEEIELVRNVRIVIERGTYPVRHAEDPPRMNGMGCFNGKRVHVTGCFDRGVFVVVGAVKPLPG